MSTEGLFGSVSSVTQRFSRLEEEIIHHATAGPSSGPAARSSTGFPTGEGAQREAPAWGFRGRGALHLYGPSRGTGIHRDGLPDLGRLLSSRERPGEVLRLPGADWRGEEASRRGERISLPGHKGEFRLLPIQWTDPNKVFFK